MITAAIVQNSVRPCRISFHAVGVVITGFALKSWREFYFTLLEVLWNVSKLPLDEQLIVLVQHIKHVLRHGLYYRLLNAIDSIV